MTRILIVEESATQAEELAFLLESRGFDVATERDGLGGLERCRREPFDAVLSDVVMPGISGYELCRRIKHEERLRSLPVILLTSLAEPLDIIHGLECGADNFITKPYDAEYLVGRIQHLLVNRSARASRKLEVGVELVLMGRRFVINSEKEQIMDLLVSTFEEVLRSRQREYEAKVAEETHRQSHQLLQSALDALSTQIAIVDVSGEILAVNAAWRRMGDVCGWTWPGSGVGEDYRSVIAGAYAAEPGDARVLLDGLASVQSGRKQLFSHEYLGRIRGEPRWFSLAGTRFEGNGLALLAIENEDITERKRAAEDVRRSEKALREQSGILNSILNSMGEGVVVADREGRPLLLNRRAEELLGAAGDGRAATQFAAFLPDQKTPLASEDHPMLRAIRGEETRDVDLFVRDQRHREGVRLSVSGAPLRDGPGHLNGGVVVMRDVTEQRKLEQQLQQSQKMEAIGQLAGGVAHDFNNLLSVITSYGEIMLREVPEGHQHRQDLRELLEAAHRGAALTRQLLAFSRRQSIQPTVLELNVVVSNIEKMLSRLIGEDIVLVSSLDPELGRVRADAGQIEQIVLNLSVNARDAMPSGGKLTIQTANVVLDEAYARTHAGVLPGTYAMLAVSDTGSGMTPEVQAHVFEPFFTTKEVGKGTGLGLSTVYGIVQQSGGHIWVESEVGRGTTIRVYLPLVEEPMVEVHDVPPRPASTRPSESILLVEDEDAVRHVAARILRDSGYRVFEAKQSGEAKAIVAEHGDRIQLLLTDVVMPDIDGPELASELLRVAPELRVLYMSGYSGSALFGVSRAKPGIAFLEKPFAPESLTRKVREVLDEVPDPAAARGGA